MGFIDTHSHIYEPEFDEDRDAVVQRAREAGVDSVLLPNINRETVQPMLDLCVRYPGYLYPMMGLHPEDVDEHYQEILDYMHECLVQPGNPYIAVGEIGLDYYWDRTWYEEQKVAFEQQVEWAKELNLPLMIHSRSAHAELVEVMRRHQGDGLRGVFHCFGGTADEAEELLQFDGFVLGIGGVLTYKKSTLPEVLQNVPLERIVVETDAPYLAPVPHRGKRNEPAFAIHTVQRLSEIYNVSAEEVMRQTTSNAKRVFTCLNA